MKHCLLIFLITFVLSCSSKTEKDNENIITIQTKPLSNSLFYTGIIRPLKTTVVSSPVDGVIIDTPFLYGSDVKEKQLLFKISSTKFITDYKAALLQYIKAKSEFNSSEAQLSEANFLHKNLLISDDEYKTKQTGFYSAQLALLQAKDTLENLLHQLNIPSSLYKLSIADVDKITKALHLEKNYESIQIYSPRDGIVLAANKNADEIKKIIKGDAIKQGDVLAVIGDANGFSVRIKVDEMTVNQINTGQKVEVTGVAFKNYSLQGEIERIDHQGDSAAGAFPTFNVDIIIPKITDAQRKIIHIGMSAKVAIYFNDKPEIAVPVEAVIEKQGQAYVQLLDTTNKKHLVKVTTGKTTPTSVVITSGLKLGDRIIAEKIIGDKIVSPN